MVATELKHAPSLYTVPSKGARNSNPAVNAPVEAPPAYETVSRKNSYAVVVDVSAKVNDDDDVDDDHNINNVNNDNDDDDGDQVSGENTKRLKKIK